MDNFYNNFNKKLEDTVEFQYENNNGLYIIGDEDYTFEIKFSGAGADSLYVYNDHIDCLAIAEGITDFNTLNQNVVYNGTSRVRQSYVGQIVLFKNMNERFAAIKIVKIKLVRHGDINNSVTFDYVIFPQGSKFQIAGERKNDINA